MSTLVTTNLKHGGASLPNIVLNSDGTFNLGDSKVVTPTGSAPSYTCRAWVNFNGTTNTGGFCTVRASGNVTSVADNGTGNYTVNFTTAMPDVNYSLVGNSSRSQSDSRYGVVVRPSEGNQTSVQLLTYMERISDAGVLFDPVIVNVAIFR